MDVFRGLFFQRGAFEGIANAESIHQISFRVLSFSIRLTPAVHRFAPTSALQRKAR